MKVGATKNWAGRLRPDFLSRCQWNNVKLKCTGDAQQILEGRRSFPSGHAAHSFAGGMFAASWLASIGQKGGSRLGWIGGKGLRVVLPFILLLLPICVAISRYNYTMLILNI